MREKLFTETNRKIIEPIVIAMAFYLAYQIRYDGQVSAFHSSQYWNLVVPLVLGRVLSNAVFGLGRHKWRFVSIVDAAQIVLAYSTFSVLPLLLRFAAPQSLPVLRVPVGVILIEMMLSLFGALGIRFFWRFLHEGQHTWTHDSKAKRLLLVGAGSQGVTVAKEMLRHEGIRIVGFVDDDMANHGAVIAGLHVLGTTRDLPDIVKEHHIDEVLICVPPADRKNLEFGNGSTVQTKVVPTIDEIRDVDLHWPRVVSLGDRVRSRESHMVLSTAIAGKTVLITGGAGFIGSSLAEKLVPSNRVILFDTDFESRPVQFTGIANHPNVQLIKGDILNSRDLEEVCREANLVIHAAAVVGVHRVCDSGRATLETNYVGTSRLLNALERNSQLERFIYFSTSEVFGVNSFRVDETSAPTIGSIAEARWSYAIAKLAGEHLVKSYFRETGMPIAIVRPFNIFGPRRIGEHAMLRFVLQALTDEPLEVRGDGSQIRSWCYIEDFCAAIIGMLEKPQAIGEDFNIGHPGNTLTIFDLARKVIEFTESRSAIRFVEHTIPDISIRVPSLAKAQKLLGYRPTYDLDSALLLTIDWYRKHLDHFVGPRVRAAGLK